MKLIRSYFIQIFFICASIFMFSFFIYSLLFLKEDKYLILFLTFMLGILFCILSTSKIEYDEYKIFVKMFTWKKTIIISQIKSITYSGLPNVCKIECATENIYMPLLYPKQKLRELFELIKKSNPTIKVLKQIG